jgi:hypothetical protein
MAITPGTYKAEFTTPLGEGSGIVVVENGRIRGGDSGMLYLGEYTGSGDSITATVKISRHSVTQAVASVFGIDNATINLKGLTTPTSATVEGTSPQAPGIQFHAVLTRVAD